MSTLEYASPNPDRAGYPPGFRARRGLNWGSVGLLYASFYLCRYNFPLANKAISDEYGYTKTQMGWIISVVSLLYACGQITNGLLTDRIGGKRAMLCGAIGTIILNIAFGAASFLGGSTPLVSAGMLFGVLLSIRGLDGYMQSFGAPGMIKMNAAWFHKKERGRFAGIFGFMINLGRFGINSLAPAILGGFVLLGAINVPPQHWRWVFFVPAMICSIITLIFALVVKETPERTGFHRPDPDEPHSPADDIAHSLWPVVRTIASNPAVWICALAYACTGAVRHGIDQWFPRYMQEVHSVDMKSAQFQVLAFMIPLVATLGSLMSGFISDLFFAGARAPVAAALYFIETIIILLAAQFHSPTAAIVFFVLIAFTANSTHSIIGTAAAMDIGGRRMAGFASGCIDSFQYFGGMLAGVALGSIVEKDWGHYFYFMVPFGFIGAVLMYMGRNIIKPKPVAPTAPRGFEAVQGGAPPAK